MSSNPPDYPSRRYQETILVMKALSMMGGIQSKQDVLRHIRSHSWLASTPEDRQRYDGHNEAKSDTLLCFGRKDAVLAGLMFDHDENDHWEITRDGQNFVEAQKRLFGTGKLAVGQCFIWTEKFKRIFDNNYVPSNKDWTLPEPKERHGGHLNLARKYV